MGQLHIVKEKLPKGWSYGLKPSHLELAILTAGIALPVSLYQNHKTWTNNAPFVSAKFFPIGHYLGAESGAFWVSSYAIPSDQRKTYQNFVEEKFLPSLIDWMVALEALPDNSTTKREKQEFSVQGAVRTLPKQEFPLVPKGMPR